MAEVRFQEASRPASQGMKIGPKECHAELTAVGQLGKAWALVARGVCADCKRLGACSEVFTSRC